ncbi:MAG: DUF3892 domain-containing protein [Lachnospira sp.]|nr:DUF3892 domain-containing protein [Lachnospira sp.]
MKDKDEIIREEEIKMQASDGFDDQANADFKKILPMMAMDEIPKAKSDAKEIIALVKHSGTVTGYQLSDGSVISKDEGISMAERGEIKGVGIAHKKDTVYLKSLPDGTENNNLSHLPTVDRTF